MKVAWTTWPAAAGFWQLADGISDWGDRGALAGGNRWGEDLGCAGHRMREA